jgi:SAM-dependent methyltransferase
VTTAPQPTAEFDAQVGAGERFRFGANWARFLDGLDEERIVEAERSLRDMLGVSSLEGRAFLDAGSGSGLFSLAAARLGASRLHSFDFDPDSVGCTQELRRRYFPGATHWTVERGSVLDPDYLTRLGRFDVVYSWGVLHHTGAMWEALGHAADLVAPGGQLFVAIYNDQGLASRGWLAVKRLYNKNALGRWLTCALFFPYFALAGAAADLSRGHNPFTRARRYKQLRGMSPLRDWHDWLGGLPFEVARPEAIFEFYRARGFELRRLRTCGGRMGCNEFVFERR